MLHFPDFTQPFALITDASSTGIGAVLIQPPSGVSSFPDTPVETSRVIAFFSRALTKSERNYATNRRELLAVVFGLEKSRFYLWGRPFLLFTDHRSLTFLFTQRDVSPLLSRWYEEIMEYDFTIKYIPGVLNILPDALSRLYPVQPRPATSPATLHVLKLMPEDLTLLTEPPRDERNDILIQAHDFGHLGAKALINRVHEMGYTWPALRREAEEYIQACRSCQRFIVARKGYHPLVNVTAEEPMAHVGIDLAGPLPETPRGNIYLLVLICLFTRFIFLVALPNKEASTIAEALYTLFCIAGFPRIIQSDNGLEFVNAVITALLKRINVDHRLSTPYHPRGNGATERAVGMVIKSIRKSLEGATVLWDLAIHAVQLALNTRVTDHHASAAFSLFFARGFPSFSTASLPEVSLEAGNTAVTLPTAPSSAALDSWQQTINDMEAIVFPAIRELRDQVNSKRASRFNKENRILKFDVGSYVMAADETRAGKLDPTHEGPFRVVQIKGRVYTLQDHDGTLLQRNYAPGQLVPVPKPAEPIPAEEIFYVERVLAHRVDLGGHYEYLIKWKNYDETHNSWEQQHIFFDVEFITKYWQSSNTDVSLDEPAQRKTGRTRQSRRH